MNSAPVLGTSPSSPTFTFALGRHYSQDCSECFPQPQPHHDPLLPGPLGPCWARCLMSGLFRLASAPPGAPGGESPPGPAWMGGLLGSPLPAAPLTLGPPVAGFAGSIKAGRRSSYLLAITTERSKSCDDGLNTFRDEGRALR